jgi:hypothetical protein
MDRHNKEENKFPGKGGRIKNAAYCIRSRRSEKKGPFGLLSWGVAIWPALIL